MGGFASNCDSAFEIAFDFSHDDQAAHFCVLNAADQQHALETARALIDKEALHCFWSIHPCRMH